LRKSIRIAPGVRMNFSKSGVGFSAGVPGFRVTKLAGGGVRRTVSIPGTGLSHVSSIGGGSSGSRGTSGARTRRSAPPPAPAPRPATPGLLAPRAEKDLYAAVQHQDVDTMERIAQEHPELALAAATLAGVLKLSRQDHGRARELLAWVFATGSDPAADPFLAKYVTARMSLEVAPGATAELRVDRAAVGLALGELLQEAGDLPGAIAVVEQLEPTTFAALSLAELYSQSGRHADVVSLTDGVTNEDDASALLCVFRGVAFREQGFYDAARAAFKEALKTKRRDAVVRHRALWERARTYVAEGKRAMARKDLERILAEDSDYAGLAEALAQLS
jgi:tetratricopeptide (TPR) repeat protein